MTASMRLVHEGCGSGHFTVGGAGDGLRKALAIASDGVHRRQSRALSQPSPWHHEPVWACRPKISAVWDGLGLLLMGLGQESDREGEVVR